MKKFDVVVLGGGPGGYPAAIRAAQMGASVALIEAGQMGGTCLNRGCIPTKTLLAGAEVLRTVRAAKEFGVSVGKVSFDYPKMWKRMGTVLDKVRGGLEGLVKSNNIEVISGFGVIQSPNEVKVKGVGTVSCDRIIVATGSEPGEVPAFPFDHERILSSTSVLQMQTIPKKMVIVGGGYIGCEFASLYRDLDCEVIILEALPSILAMGCETTSKALLQAFEAKGIEVRTHVSVEGIKNTGNAVKVALAGGETIDADVALVAVGRKLNTSNIGLESIGIQLGPKGEIPVNERMETSVAGVYAIGDVTAKAMLAHVASHQGLVAGMNAVGKEAHIDYRSVPSVVFTDPEIAMVGLTLKQAIEEGYDATVGQLPFQVLGKAQATAHVEGFAQIVSDKRTGQVLGAQVVGHEASTLIGEMGVVIHNELTLDCLTETIHAHPTIAEAWLEAALIANETPVHFPPPRKRKKAAI